MAKMIINGEVCSGSNSYASAVEYIKDDGSKTTVQNELDGLNSNIDDLNKKLDICPQKTFSNWGSLINSLNNGITIFRPSDLKLFSPVSGTMDDWGTVTIIKAGHQHETSIIWHSVNVPNNYAREVYIGLFDGTQVSWDKLN